MNTYHIYAVLPGKPCPNANPHIVECETDAEGLGEACRILGRMRGAGAVEVWTRDHKLVRLGGRPRA